MRVKPIRTKRDHMAALSEIEAMMNGKIGRDEEAKLEVLGILVEAYEKDHFPIEAPSPSQAIKFRMEQMGLKQVDIVDLVGSRGRVSEILSGKRPLTLPMIRRISGALSIPTEVLVQEESAA